MNNGSECSPGGCHGLQSRCSDENWEVGSIPTRFRNNYMLILVIAFFLNSFIFPQGMYIDKVDTPIYSLNLIFSSFNSNLDINNDGTLNDIVENYYGLSLSSVFKGKNELSLGYKENKNSKIINTSYSYYIKPDFYINMFAGISYNYIQKTNSNKNEYTARVGFYGNDKNNTESSLKHFPFFIYEYSYVLEHYYDAVIFGYSLLFNDIGIEPSYRWIDNNHNEFSLKIYLWEFEN